MIRSLAVDEFVVGLTSGDAWLGASDAANEGTWLWVTDGDAFWIGNTATGTPVNGAYQNWNVDEPTGGVSSNCMRVVPALGEKWADLDCEALHSAVCEGPAL